MAHAFHANVVSLQILKITKHFAQSIRWAQLFLLVFSPVVFLPQ